MANSLLPEWLKNGFVNSLNPFIGILSKKQINPNTFTVLGLIITVGAVPFFVLGNLLIAGILILLGGICDIIDGKLARASGKVSKFGALFDSSIDRYSEVFMFFGAGIYFVMRDDYYSSSAIFLGLGGSMMVSYVRARAEGLGFDCKIGFMQRPERVVLFGAGAIINELALQVAAWSVAVLGNITAIQRLAHIYNLEKNKKGSSL